jgi:hypothetical protein
MLRLDFESENIEIMLPNAAGRCRAERNYHECGKGRDELVECGN